VHVPKLLVVDDEEPTVLLIQRILLRAGYDVVTATQPIVAAQRAELGERFDLVVLDVAMPQLSGEMLAARMRHHDPDLKVLYVTGYDEALFQAHPVLWEGESYLEKPFTSEGLQQAVALALYGTTSKPADSPT
jgi:two-component system cell cycle sensor histidine kinase/response regulator CckA